MMIGILLFWALCAAVDGQYRFDYSYSEAAGGWLKLHLVPASWDRARVRCGLEGAVLASPTSSNMTAELLALMKGSGLDQDCGLYTGTSAQFAKGVYYSIEGVPLERMPVQWLPSEPDNQHDSEDCIALGPGGAVGDVNCTELLPYVCYQRAGRLVPSTECGTPDTGYKLFAKTGHCYKFHAVARSWPGAFEACASEGGYLAIPDDRDEAMHLKDLFNQNLATAAITTKFKSVMHLGLKDIGSNGVWTTIHGAPLEDGYAAWEKTQPDGRATGQTCGAMFQSGLLDDFQCSGLAPFVCEKTTDSLQ